MKKQFITFILIAFFFFIFSNSLAQSLATSSENVTIKIVKKISVLINNKNKEEGNKRNNFWEKIKTPKRNLLVSYNYVRNNAQNSSVSISLSKHYKNSIVKNGELKELKNLSDDEKLFISIKNMEQTESAFQKHFVTIVY